MLTQQQIDTVEAALYAADSEFLEVYYYYKKKYNKPCSRYGEFEEEDDAGHFQYFLDMKNECKAYARMAVHLLREGNVLGAIDEIWSAHACEGDFCGWRDFRVYETPRKLLVEDILLELGYLYVKIIGKRGRLERLESIDMEKNENKRK